MTILADPPGMDERALLEALRAAEQRALDAERSARARGDFLASMSHEIRTPMTAILGLCELALHKPLAPAVRDDLEKIHGSARSLLGIINDILDYSKIEAGRLRIEHVAFDLARLLNTLRTIFGARAAQRAVDLRIEVDPAVPRALTGDALRLQQVLSNLLGNALKFTARGHVLLRIACLAREEDRIRLRWSVEDTGIGMDQETLARLFRPFAQGDASIARRFGGTGLGLTISRELLRLMGSDIQVASRPDEGSVFAFDLTLELARDVPAVPPESTEAPHSNSLAGLRVLVAEDHPINRQVIRDLLQLRGIQVTLAGNGREALDWLDSAPFDLVLMDVQMPEMDGLTATRRIRERPALATLPVIALTAGVTAAERERVMASGMNDLLAKPIDLERLDDTLRRWSGGNGAMDAVASDARSSAVAAEAEAGMTAGTAGRLALPGFDLRTLGTIMDDAEIVGLLREFAEHIRGDLETLDNLLAQRHWRQAHGVTHRLKGLAGNLGAIDLAAAAARLDQEIQGGDYARATLVELHRAHARTLARIGRLHLATAASPDAAASAAAPVPDTAAMPLELLSRLQCLLADLDWIPEELLAELDAALPPRHQTLYRIFRHHVDQFEYRKARAVLDQMVTS